MNIHSPDLDNFSRGMAQNPAEMLPGSANIVRSFDTQELSKLTDTSFSIHPKEPLPDDLSTDMSTIATEVVRRFPNQRIDVTVNREDFTLDNVESFSTSILGIHDDGFEFGFFVLSTDEPTVFYDNVRGNNPKPAKAGDLIFVPRGCFHSSPKPSQDGTRVRIKLIPQRPIASHGSRFRLPRDIFRGL